MKKKNFIRALKWLQDAGLKAFIILLLVAGGYYAYAEFVWPAGAPTPVTGVVGLFVGASSQTFGAVPADKGYEKVNAYCASVTTPDNKTVTGAHICTPDEMANSYNHITATSGVKLKTTGLLWISNGPPGYIASSNDCGGWSFTSQGSDKNYPNYGSVWDFAKQYGFITICDTGVKFACCK